MFAAALLAVALGGVGVAQAQSLQRHESQFWVWYAPARWVAAEGRAGIDISSPTGVHHVGYAFSGWPGPVSHADVVNLVAGNGALDVHPLRSVRVSRGGRAAPFGGGVRRVYTWRAYRTDRREGTRGVLKVDVFNSDATATYGFAATVYNSPTRSWRRQRRLLARLSRVISFKPESPFAN